jgi:branched-chain amino acid transport system ATP-binding protein
MTGLEIEQLVVTYGPVRAVNGISLSVDTGHTVALLGANGAGKTSTLNAVSGLLKPASGRVRLNGRDITRQRAFKVARAGLVHVPEGRRIVGPLTVEENLLLGAYACDRHQAQRTLAEIMEMFPILGERRSQRAGLLSGGEQQMLAFGRGLMSDPAVMVIDEPSMGLAPRVIGTVVNAIRAIKDRGIGVLIVEQNVSVALALADTAHVMSLGEIVVSGDPEHIRNSREVVGAYMGSAAEPGKSGSEAPA